jgi:hypothetical protein
LPVGEPFGKQSALGSRSRLRQTTSGPIEIVRTWLGPSCGADVEPGAGERDDFGLKCRLYHTPEGIRGVPPDELILSALKGKADGGGSNGPSAAEHST